MSWADDQVAKLQPWIGPGPDLEWLIRAKMVMYAQVELFAEDQDDGTPGWSVMLDVDNAPAYALPYLAQWVGERLPAGIDEAAARQWIRDTPNQWRGTPYSIARAAQRWLTGAELVQIRERSKLDGTDDEDWIAVQTFTAQTPNADLVRMELRKVVPGDIRLDFQVVDGATWEGIKLGYATWAAVKGALPTWTDVAGATAGYISWER